MHSPARALMWEFRRRHRWGLMAIGVYLVVIGTAGRIVTPPSGHAYVGSERFAFTVSIPLTVAFLYLLTMFTFGHTGDFAASESLFPMRLLLLPLPTASLTGVPMLCGMTCVAALWVLSALLAFRPSGVHVPLIWPAFFGAAFLGWAQVLTWTSYPLRGLRVILAVLLLVIVDTVVLLAMYFDAPQYVMLALLAPQLPLAYLVARRAVGLARQGHVPVWLGPFSQGSAIRSVRARRPVRFASPADAQFWLEWRQYGRTLPAMVGLLLPFQLALLFLHINGELLVGIMLGVLFTPPFAAAFVARSFRGATHFAMMRPMTNAALIAAKMKATLVSTLVTWLMLLIAIPLALTISGKWFLATHVMRQLGAIIGMPRAASLVASIVAGLLASTFKQLAQSIWIGLSGRAWLVTLSTAGMLLLVVLSMPLSEWILHSKWVAAALFDALPWILAVLVCLKLVTAAFLAERLDRAHVVRDEQLLMGAAVWMLAVFGVYSVFAWMLSGPHVPHYMLMLVAILFVPLVRLAAAPLAIAGSRNS